MAALSGSPPAAPFSAAPGVASGPSYSVSVSWGGKIRVFNTPGSRVVFVESLALKVEASLMTESSILSPGKMDGLMGLIIFYSSWSLY